jgi:hypothetical protein
MSEKMTRLTLKDRDADTVRDPPPLERKPSMARRLSAVTLALVCLQLAVVGPALAAGRQTAQTSPPACTRVAAPSGVSRRGTCLLLNGQPIVLSGINAPQAATDYEVNGGCGAAIDIDRLFGSLAPNSVVRVGFGQDAAINGATGARDWRALDRVVAAAERSTTHVRLILGITNQAGTCDGTHWRGHDWYAGAYRDVPPSAPDGLPRVSYWNWIHELVPRYAASTAVGMWEPVGEPEAAVCAPGYDGGACYTHKTCPADATAVLRTFFDVIGAEFHRMDPAHLVASGSLGGDQCGWAGNGSLVVQGSPGIDVATFHDYGSDTTAVPPWLSRRIDESRTLAKPIITEEVGITAGPACTSTSRRASELDAKRRGGAAQGVAGFLPWLYSQSTGRITCDDQLRPDDPAMAALARPASV